MKRIILGIFALVLCLGIGSSAQAVDSPFVIDNVPNVIGAAGGMAPDYLGSNNYRGVGAPFFRWTFPGQERYLQLFVSELSLNLVNRPDFNLGPVVNYRFGRDHSNIDDKAVKKMEDIDGAVELGAFASYVWREQNNPRHRFIVTGEVLFDVTNVYESGIAMASMRYWVPISRPIDVLVGVGTTYGSGSYMNTYFGVDEKDSLASGLRQYTAGSGFRDWNAQAALVFHFSESWHVGVGVKYFDLVDKAGGSPIVSQVGDRNQVVGGIGVAYSWK